MGSRSEFSVQTLLVLAVLCEEPSQWRHGYALASATGALAAAARSAVPSAVPSVGPSAEPSHGPPPGPSAGRPGARRRSGRGVAAPAVP